ncbi:restriction endonuclease subunit S [Phocaeicola plebeius]|jgi:type I restriction enzyme S subunit|uniref:restriction endonuclease subunit S n=1 Tax=Phocaeicola plebeius TaxID=310297 RepID=UPI00307B42D5
MSKLQELIKELCPDGVEFRKLGEVCEILDSKRQPIAKGKRIPGKYPYYGANGVQDYVDNYIFDGVFLLVGEDGSVINKDNSPVLNWAVGKIWVNNHAHILAEKYCCNLRYLYFILQVTNVSKIVRGMPPKINQENLINIEIPLPPLEVQNEIVRILNAFTAHTAELQAELQARKEQYEYYRNKLLTFDENDERVKWMTLGEVSVNVCSGGTPSTSNKKYYQGHIPWLRTQEVDWKDVFYTKIKISEDAIKNSSAKIIPPNCVIVAMYGATAGKTCINKIPLTTNQACCNLEINKDIALYKYVYYWLYKEYYKLKALGEGSQSNISGKKIKSYAIPIPPLSEQQRIISILDKFESLVNDLSEGLPAEIAAVQEQYEYYRNKLLTFKRKS